MYLGVYSIVVTYYIVRRSRVRHTPPLTFVVNNSGVYWHQFLPSGNDITNRGILLFQRTMERASRAQPSEYTLYYTCEDR